MTRVVVSTRSHLSGKLRPPPSKSYTHRAVLTASLSQGTGRVSNLLRSRDTLATVEACRAIGATLEDEGDEMVVTGCTPGTPENVLNVENSGTTLRFMTSVCSLPPVGHVVLTGDSSIRRRPMQPLLDTLSALGARAWSSRGNGCAPIIVEAGGFRGGKAELRGDVSSQFVSSVLVSSPLAQGNTDLSVVGAVSRPYIDATLEVLGAHNVDVEREGYSRFRVRSEQEYSPCDFEVPADFSSASFIMAAVVLLGGTVELSGLNPRLPQADSAILRILKELGARVSVEAETVTVKADGEALRGGSFDLRDTPDLLPVVAVLALKCEGPVEITGVSHARFKETDRVSVLAQELNKIGTKVEERPDGLLVSRPAKLTPAPLDAHDDHRMFMAFALASTLVPGGIPVTGVESLDVSYPNFLEDMKALGAEVGN